MSLSAMKKSTNLYNGLFLWGIVDVALPKGMSEANATTHLTRQIAQKLGVDVSLVTVTVNENGDYVYEVKFSSFDQAEAAKILMAKPAFAADLTDALSDHGLIVNGAKPNDAKTSGNIFSLKVNDRKQHRVSRILFLIVFS